VLSASKIALSDAAANYWLWQRRVRIDTERLQHIPREARTPETFTVGVPVPATLYTLPDVVDYVLKVSIPADLDDPLSPNGVYQSSFELFDNDDRDLRHFFQSLDADIKRFFNSSFDSVGNASIGLKDIMSAADFYTSGMRRQALMQRSLTHPPTEASWRASVDGLIESLWAFGQTVPMVSFEPSWRLVDPSDPKKVNKIWEPNTIRPDVVLASQVPNEPPPPHRQHILFSIGQVSGMYQHVSMIQSVINTVETRCLAEFPTIDLTCLIIEYKKESGSRHIRQLTMAMVTSLHHFYTMRLHGLEWPVFGLLIEANIATLYVGWMDVGAGHQINVVDIWDHPRHHAVRGPSIFYLHHAFDALRFCCFLRRIQWYGERVARQADENLTEIYQSIWTSFRAGGQISLPHCWYCGSIARRS